MSVTCPKLSVMKKKRQQAKSVQLHLLDRRPATHRVWQAMSKSAQHEVIDLLATMMQQHIEMCGKEVDDE